jgi:hypothetical protein
LCRIPEFQKISGILKVHIKIYHSTKNLIIPLTSHQNTIINTKCSLKIHIKIQVSSRISDFVQNSGIPKIFRNSESPHQNLSFHQKSNNTIVSQPKYININYSHFYDYCDNKNLNNNNNIVIVIIIIIKHYYYNYYFYCLQDCFLRFFYPIPFVELSSCDKISLSFM